MAIIGGTVAYRKDTLTKQSASDAIPQAESGSGAAGTSDDYARADHVHPAVPGSPTVDELKNATVVLNAVASSIGTGTHQYVIESGVTAHRYYWISCYLVGTTSGDRITWQVRHVNQAGTREFRLIVTATTAGNRDFYAKVYRVDET
jgi:hypothetical protein